MKYNDKQCTSIKHTTKQEIERNQASDDCSGDPLPQSNGGTSLASVCMSASTGCVAVEKGMMAADVPGTVVPQSGAALQSVVAVGDVAPEAGLFCATQTSAPTKSPTPKGAPCDERRRCARGTFCARPIRASSSLGPSP